MTGTDEFPMIELAAFLLYVALLDTKPVNWRIAQPSIHQNHNNLETKETIR